MGGIGGGLGVTSIANPDGTKAYYSTMAVRAYLNYSLFGNEKGWGEVGLIGTANFSSLTNSVRINGESEMAYLAGPGAGVYFRVWRFYASAEGDYLIARHYASGRALYILDYTLMTTKTIIGIHLWPFDRFGFLIGSSNSFGVVPKSMTSLSQNSPYQEQIYFAELTYFF